MSESKYLHEVIVGNIGMVYSGRSVKEAQEKFRHYKALSKKRGGRAQDEEVAWMRDGEIYREYIQPKKPLRTHNEFFSPVSLGNRKSCPTCGEKLKLGESPWAWYEYVRVQKRLVMYFCRSCFTTSVVPRLREHAAGCGCVFSLQVQIGFNQQKPEWLTLETVEESV